MWQREPNKRHLKWRILFDIGGAELRRQRRDFEGYRNLRLLTRAALINSSRPRLPRGGSANIPG
jgi:hypothetical protein